MPTSGLLITLAPEASHADEAVSALASRTDLTLGERRDRWLPAALEADDDAGCRAAHDAIAALPGVAFVDVVSVDFGDDFPLEPTPQTSLP